MSRSHRFWRRKSAPGSVWLRVLPWLLTFCVLLPAATCAADSDSQKVDRSAALIRTGNLDQAEGILWEVLSSHPDDVQALNLLATIRLQQKRLTESETLLRRATRLDPESLAARANLARVFNAQGQTDKEIVAWLDAVRLAPTDAEVNSSLAAAYLKGNEYQKALEALQRIPKGRRPDKAFPLFAAAYLGLGRVAETRALVPAIMARGRKNPRLPVEFSEVLLDFDLWREARDVLGAAQKLQTPNSELFFALGRACERNQELALAQKDYQRALELDPKSVAALQALARLLAGQGQWKKALGLLTRAHDLAPDSPEVLRKLTAVSMRAGQSAQAVDAAQHLVQLRPEEPEALYLLGAALLQNGDNEEARSTLDKYAKLRPEEPQAYLALGMAKLGLRDMNAARINFEQSVKLDPKQDEAYFQLSLILRDQGDNAGAISDLEKAIAVNPRHARAQALLGELYMSQRDYQKAQSHLASAEELAPDFPDTHYQLGLLYARMNQRDRAQREMEQFHKLKERENPGPRPPGERATQSVPPVPPS
jgi:tetratricopeptide (TPR) repeat protein